MVGQSSSIYPSLEEEDVQTVSSCLQDTVVQRKSEDDHTVLPPGNVRTIASGFRLFKRSTRLSLDRRSEKSHVKNCILGTSFRLYCLSSTDWLTKFSWLWINK